MARQPRKPAHAPIQTQTQATVRIPVPDGEDGVVFPEGGVPCEKCGLTVKTLHANVVVIMEPVPGQPYWAATCRKCTGRGFGRRTR